MVMCIYCRRWIKDSTRVCRWCVEAHEAAWESILPSTSTYASTDMDKLLAAHPKLAPKYREILQWNPDTKKGLLIYGKTGLGKSRCAWTMLRMMHDRGYSVFGIQATELGNQIGHAFYNGYGLKLMSTIAAHDIVFIDDLDKMKPTDRVECEIFALTEKLCGDKRLIITTNLRGEDFVARFAPSIGAPLLRRLQEFCIPVSMFE